MATATKSLTVTNSTFTVTLEGRIGSDGVWTTDDFTIESDDEVELRWSSTGSSGCHNFGTGGFNVSGTSGTDTDVIEPSVGNSITYNAICSDHTFPPNHLSDNLTVTTAALPTVTLEQRIGASGSWSTSDVTINPGAEVHLQWLSLIHISEPTRPY